MTLEDKIFDTSIPFLDRATEVFKFQYKHVDVYREYCDAIGYSGSKITGVNQFPFLPVSFFKSHKVLAGGKPVEKIFESSTTSGDEPSRHFVHSLKLYNRSILTGFNKVFGQPKDYVILGLLPSYLERNNASLVYMADHLMKESGHELNGFFLDELDQLRSTLTMAEKRGQKTILFGVTFALLDFAEKFYGKLKHTIIIETGGMKGRRDELIRSEVHDRLKRAFGCDHILSEYGMTEMLSQAYLGTDGLFEPTSTLKILSRDVYDPLDVKEAGKGALNVIDLSNLYSCSFMATDDIGSVKKEGNFTVDGRLDAAQIRGCNLMTI